MTWVLVFLSMIKCRTNKWHDKTGTTWWAELVTISIPRYSSNWGKRNPTDKRHHTCRLSQSIKSFIPQLFSMLLGTQTCILLLLATAVYYCSKLQVRHAQGQLDGGQNIIKHLAQWVPELTALDLQQIDSLPLKNKSTETGRREKITSYSSCITLEDTRTCGWTISQPGSRKEGRLSHQPRKRPCRGRLQQVADHPEPDIRL